MRLYGSYDVVVVGGGASGSAAALEAARNGASVCLIEINGGVGGMLNIVGPPGWAFDHGYNNAGERIHGGIVKELWEDCLALDCAMPEGKPEDRSMFTQNYIDIDYAGILLFEKLRNAGVHFLLHTMAVDVLKEDDTVRGVIVENTSGRMVVMGKIIIEASGEGDIGAKAGVPFNVIDKAHEEIDPPSITFHMDGVDWKKVTEYYKSNPDQFIPEFAIGREDAYADMIARRMAALKECDSIIDLVRAGIVDQIDYRALTMEALHNGDLHPYGDLGHFFTPRQFGVVQAAFQHTAQAFNCDTTDITEYSAGEAETRRQVAIAIKAIQKYLPGYDKAYLTRITSSMRTREGRHFVGDYTMVGDEVTNCAKFDDVIAKCTMIAQTGPFHSAATPGTAMNIQPRAVWQCEGGGSYDIPYRCLVPKNVEGMLITGKCMSMSLDFKRDQLPDNMLWGQAAGAAAALCVKNNISPREMEKDVSELQAVLKAHGAILDGTK